MRRIKRMIFILLILFTVLSLSSCKKKDKGIDVKTMHTVTFMVDGTQYGRSYIVEGEQSKPINGPIIEGRKFLYWGLNGTEFDFNTAIYENIVLDAHFEEAATIVITDHININNLTNEKFLIHNDIIKGSVVKGSLIKPGNDGSCYFYLSNSTPFDITFTVNLTENNIVGIPLQYYFRTVTNNDNTRIWKDISEFKNISITIPATSRLLFSLDWVWQHQESSITEIYVNESSSYVDISFSFSNFTKAE